MVDRSFRVTAARAWNSLPTSVNTATSLVSFKKQLKTFLFTKSFLEFQFVYRVLEALLLMLHQSVRFLLKKYVNYNGSLVIGLSYCPLASVIKAAILDRSLICVCSTLEVRAVWHSMTSRSLGHSWNIQTDAKTLSQLSSAAGSQECCRFTLGCNFAIF